MSLHIRKHPYWVESCFEGFCILLFFLPTMREVSFLTPPLVLFFVFKPSFHCHVVVTCLSAIHLHLYLFCIFRFIPQPISLYRVNLLFDYILLLFCPHSFLFSGFICSLSLSVLAPHSYFISLSFTLHPATSPAPILANFTYLLPSSKNKHTNLHTALNLSPFNTTPSFLLFLFSRRLDNPQCRSPYACSTLISPFSNTSLTLLSPR